ncbi:glycerophosphoryl diester phosphodiesterase [Microbacterium sorbitolivorans]|uniref:glycerophosphodiester phosphodiesterase n=1 Tax=Microbacterium sorbitolivorans TaxID=1867410 RepID=A0A367XXW8_9MICO|nr:glycerophosphodiester phosphodiesterase family protein [Microbacterium sorbitolivorans]RCK58467.1 glycerophosphodiester phosphodiesterase [Microbacterium sorbitolivorans]GGF36771.1 glycerophosphoryl diester phosphodiesterase [Microbacterium sorbitolivorans]
MTAIIGHRGASGYRPEHTRSAYDLALAQGVDLVEPDVVATKDGVLVVRHENEISGTTDVASHPEFAHLKTTKSFAGYEFTGWFTEDFTWDELQTLRCTERIPKIRPANAAYDGTDRILSLPEVLDIARAGGVGVVVEVKHSPYFASIGLDLAPLVARDLRAGGWQDEDRGRLVIESFEESALHQVRDAGIDAELVYLLEDDGVALDLLIAHGSDAPSYRDQLADLGSLAERVDGISVDKSLLLDADAPSFAGEARERGLELFTWTARPENAFLAKRFRGSGARAEYGEWRAEWRAIREAGVTGVFADHPDLAREIFGDLRAA